MCTEGGSGRQGGDTKPSNRRNGGMGPGQTKSLSALRGCSKDGGGGGVLGAFEGKGGLKERMTGLSMTSERLYRSRPRRGLSERTRLGGMGGYKRCCYSR